MISSHVKISMTSVILSLSLNLYLNSLVYHRNIFGSSSKVFGNLRTSSEIFGNYRKYSGTFVWPSGQFWKIFGNLRKEVGNLRKIIKTPSSVCLYNKKNITRQLEDMNFMFSRQINNYLYILDCKSLICLIFQKVIKTHSPQFQCHICFASVVFLPLFTWLKFSFQLFFKQHPLPI